MAGVTHDWEVLGDGPFRLAGEPRAVAFNDTHVCVAGTVGFPQWGWTRDASRGNLEGHGHRVTVFNRITLRPIALHRLRHSVNDIALDDSGRFLLIATGEYDGGWMYHGELLALDLREGTRARIVSSSREYLRVSWRGEGTLEFVVSPFGDEDSEGFRRMRMEGVDIASLMASPENLPEVGENVAEVSMRDLENRKTTSASTLADLANGEHEVRTGVWDIAIDARGCVIDCLERVALEAWDVAGDRRWSVEADTSGGQLAVCGDTAIAWGIGRPRFVPLEGWAPGPTTLIEVNLADGAPSPLPVEPRPGAGLMVSRDDGALLFRPDHHHDPQMRDAPSLLLLPGSTEPLEVDLLGYNLFNHHLVVRETPDLLATVGEGPHRHEDKWIVRVRDDGGLDRLYPLEWDSARGAHFFPDFGLVTMIDDIRVLFHSARVHSSSGRGLEPGGALIVARRYDTGELLWDAAFDAQCSGMGFVRGLLLTTLVSGELVALDGSSGREEWSEPTVVDGERVTPLSLAASGDWIAIGLADGRILRSRLCP